MMTLSLLVTVGGNGSAYAALQRKTAITLGISFLPTRDDYDNVREPTKLTFMEARDFNFTTSLKFVSRDINNTKLNTGRSPFTLQRGRGECCVERAITFEIWNFAFINVFRDLVLNNLDGIVKKYLDTFSAMLFCSKLKLRRHFIP